MDAHWDLFLINIHDEPAIIRIDSSLAKTFPLKKYPLNVHCSIPVSTLPSNGVRDEKTLGTIGNFENAAEAIARKQGNALYVGRVDYDSHVMFDFYTVRGDGLIKRLFSSARLHSISTFKCGADMDVQWSTYKLLLPDAAERNLLENNKRRRALLA